jgi:nicotinamide phosphoribosyltransferase
MGGALLQKLNRDTQHFAFKCSSVTIHGVEYDVYKKPVTDPRKISKAGRLKLIRAEDGSLRTVHPSEPGEDLLVEVFRDGEIRRKWTFEECRARAKG